MEKRLSNSANSTAATLVTGFLKKKCVRDLFDDSECKILYVRASDSIRVAIENIFSRNIKSVLVFDETSNSFVSSLELADIQVFLIKQANINSVLRKYNGKKVSEILCLPEFERLTCGQVSEMFRRPFVPIDLSISLENAISELVLSDVKRLIAFGPDGQPVGVLSQSRIVFGLSSYLIASHVGQETIEQLFKFGDESDDSESFGFEVARRDGRADERDEFDLAHSPRSLPHSPHPPSHRRSGSKDEKQLRFGSLHSSGDILNNSNSQHPGPTSPLRHSSSSTSPGSHSPTMQHNRAHAEKLTLAETRCFPDTETVSSVFNYLQRKKISAVAVCDASWKLIGVVSVSDLRKVETLEVLSGGIDCELPISEFIAPVVERMREQSQPYPVIIPRTCSLAVALCNMQRYKIHQIFVCDSPVVGGNMKERCVRVITLMDIILVVHRHFIERPCEKKKKHRKSKGRRSKDKDKENRK